MPHIFKILDSALFHKALIERRFFGAENDCKDGFIHFSDATQLHGTARLHFAGRNGLLIFAVEAKALGDALKWERSRGGQLFPHYFGALDMALVLWVKPLPWNGETHDFPQGIWP